MLLTPLAVIDETLLAVIVAAATAVGAGVGGVVTSVIPLLAQNWRADAENRIALTRAGRLVDEELRDATEVIRNRVYQGERWQPGRRYSSAVYTEYRETLVTALEDQDWGAVSRAYQELNRVNWEDQESDTSGTPTQGMNPLDQVDLLSVGIAVVEARQALAASAAPPDVASLLEGTAEEVAAVIFPSPPGLDEALDGALDDPDSEE